MATSLEISKKRSRSIYTQNTFIWWKDCENQSSRSWISGPATPGILYLVWHCQSTKKATMSDKNSPLPKRWNAVVFWNLSFGKPSIISLHFHIAVEQLFAPSTVIKTHCNKRPCETSNRHVPSAYNAKMGETWRFIPHLGVGRQQSGHMILSLLHIPEDVDCLSCPVALQCHVIHRV